MIQLTTHLKKISLSSKSTLESQLFLVLSILLGMWLLIITKPTLEYERSLRITTIDFISNMGGLFGLCVGFSFISGIEILYWFIVRLVRNLASREVNLVSIYNWKALNKQNNRKRLGFFMGYEIHKVVQWFLYWI